MYKWLSRICALFNKKTEDNKDNEEVEDKVVSMRVLSKNESIAIDPSKNNTLVFGSSIVDVHLVIAEDDKYNIDWPYLWSLLDKYEYRNIVLHKRESGAVYITVTADDLSPFTSNESRYLKLKG